MKYSGNIKMYSCSSFGYKEQSAMARGGKELTGLYIKENSTGQMGYVISDHLGSVWALANESGGFIEQYAYDPWGKRMDPTDWTKTDTTRTEFITDRGFTLHEHYDHMQILNMLRETKSRRQKNINMAGNARMYDPLMGQFISVDPLADKYPGIGAYVYCANNPLIYVDLSGEEFTFGECGEEELFNAIVDELNYQKDELEADIEATETLP